MPVLRLVALGLVVMGWGQLGSLPDGMGGRAVVARASDMTADVTGPDFGQVQAAIARQEYELSWQAAPGLAVLEGGAYQAPNRAQGLRSYFTPEGVWVTAREVEGERWQGGLALRAVGGQPVVETSAPEVQGHRIEYRRGALRAWYENEAKGLTMGFTLHEWASRPTGELVLTLDLRGNLTPVLESDGRALSLREADGPTRLRLTVANAVAGGGGALPARLRLGAGGTDEVEVVVQTPAGQAPLTVALLVSGDLSTANATILANQVGASLGYSVASAGDINGDGYDDVIVGAPNYDKGEYDEGAAFVFLGGPEGIRSGSPATANATFESNQTGADLGHRVAGAGDVNGDGYADVIVSAPNYDSGETDEGAAFVFLGEAGGIRSGSPTTANTTLQANQVGASLGYSIESAGDANGDGYADVIVGAPHYDSGETDEGAAFVFLGGAGGIPSGDPSTASTTIESNQSNADLGWSVASAGDVNGDSYADIIIGALSYTSGEQYEGAVFLFHGGAGGIGNGSPATANATLQSNQGYATLGQRVASAGDVNGDGYSDVVVSARRYNNEGTVFVFHGGPAGIGDGSPATANAILQADQAGAQLGYSLASAGDVNGDGYADIIAGAPVYKSGEPDEGAMFVFYGGPGGIRSGSTATANIALQSNLAGATLGYANSAAGDVNGDGYADLIVGAPGYRGADSDEGAAFVFHGGPGGIRSGSPSTANTALQADQPDARLGASIASAGDVNGDGYSDLIVGAPHYDSGESNEGAAFIFHGSPRGISDGSPSTVNAVLQANQVNAALGTSVANAGDVNDDGYSDVIIGAPQYDSGHPDEGVAFVFHGGPGGIRSGNPTTANATIQANQANSALGSSVASAGDINDDGYSDVIIGAHHYDGGRTDEGAVFVFHGGPGGIRSGGPPMATTAIQADQVYAHLGSSVSSAGDVNGDGYADVIIGALSYSSGQAWEGGAFVFQGGPGGIPNGSLAMANATLQSNQPSANLGWSVASAGDVNGDGYADVIVGAPHYDSGERAEGAVFGFYGGPSGILSGDPTTANATIQADQMDAHLGWSVASAGDVNGDGYSDIIVGAPHYDMSEYDEGAVFVFHGGRRGIRGRSPSTANATLQGNQVDARLGESVVSAGDVNGDSYSDVLIGASNYASGQMGEGAVFVFQGGPEGIRSGGPSSANTMVQANQVSANLGWSVAGAGDVNGDGYADVIVGAFRYDSGEEDEGAAFVFHGGPGGIRSGDPSSANAMVQANQAGANLGRSVASAGDVNGDGYGDVIVGAQRYTNGHLLEGGAFVFHGGPEGIRSGNPATANAIIQSDQVVARLGQSVASAGDVNGDGYGDLIIGAYRYSSGEQYEGAAFVFHGGPEGIRSGNPATANATIQANQMETTLGLSVASAGDVNNDGYSDVIVGAPQYYREDSFEGRAFVFHGGPGGISGGDPTTANATLQANQPRAWLGGNVASAGDVNGDGYDDVIIGAPSYDNGEEDEGAAFVFFGGPEGVGDGSPSTADAVIQGNQVWAHLGNNVASAGDVNSDGHGDVIVDAVSYVSGQGREAALVFYGGPGGLRGHSPETADATLQANQAGASLGSAASAGDVNGDGYGDIIVGSQGYDLGEVDEGAAFIFYGNAGGGLALRPQQRRADESAPVAAGGQSLSPTEVRLAALGRSPWGRSELALEWELKPEGVPFDGTGVQRSPAWIDSGAPGSAEGVALNALVSGLRFEQRYHWRLRLLGRPLHTASPTLVTYRSRWLVGGPFFTALSGEQPITRTGPIPLLGQSSTVNISTQGKLTHLRLRGYPQTSHPQENSTGHGRHFLDRYYALTPDVTDSSFSLQLCLAYDDAEAAGTGMVEDGLQLCRWTGSGWACSPRSLSSSTATNLVCADEVSTLSEWVIAASFHTPTTPTASATATSTPAGTLLPATPTATPSATATSTPVGTIVPPATPTGTPSATAAPGGPFSDSGVVLPELAASAAAWGDYDNDGDLDLLLTGRAGETPHSLLYRNDGGHLADSGQALPGVADGAVAWGDYDNDGDLDLLLSGQGAAGPLAQLWHNQGGPAGGTPVLVESGLVLPGVRSGSLAWADYDNNGTLDFLLTGRTATGRLATLYRNHGSAPGAVPDFRASATLAGVSHSATAWGDSDNDGDLDLFLTGWTGVSRLARLYRNDGGQLVDSGASLVEEGVTLPGVSGGAADWGDYDSDGHLDLFLTGESDSGRVARIYHNGGGTLTGIGAGLPGLNESSGGWGDYDNDGDLDLLLAGFTGSATVTWLYRNGAGRFTLTATSLPGISDGTLAWGDYDNDGDLDLLVSGQQDHGLALTRLLRNESQQANSPPTAPTGLTATWQGGQVRLAWAPAEDGQTPPEGLSYNLRVGVVPGGSELLSPMADPLAGTRRLPALGNAGPGLTATLTLPPGTYYWSVQAIDTIFGGSAFAQEAIITNTTPLCRDPDVTGDGAVTIMDLQRVAGAFGADGTLLNYDLDCSGVVDVGDIQAVAAAWTPSP